jgi:pyridoxal phosphate enzyme (YggS family)
MTVDPAARPLPAPPPAGAARGIDRLRANLTTLYERVDAARARGASASPRVTVCIVTKAAPADAFDLLRSLGEREVGENRIQDAVSKRMSAPVGFTWHGIGHLQTNKAKKALGVFDVFHALDRLPLAEALEPLLAAADRRWPVYAQVNAARDPGKSGVEPEKAIGFLEELTRFPHLEVVGLMTMAREDDRGERARPTFRLLREVRDEAMRRGVGDLPPAGLSMGMSDDFEVAVEEGATVVRVGRAAWEGVGRDDPLDAGRGPRTVTPETP